MFAHPLHHARGYVFAHVLFLYLSDAREVGAHIELIPFAMTLTIYAIYAFIGS
jgi:hypothetical protein